MKHFSMILILASVCSLGLGACNTMQGIGKDVQKAGETLESAAKKK